jgi:PadR family transcriptional regulator, regulatory protein PadR
MTPKLRLSPQMAAILAVMVVRPSHEWYGLEVQRAAHIGSGTLYPALRRLENLGWLASQWEDLGDDVGRPRRRLYRVTGEGELAARDYLARAERQFDAATWRPTPGEATT